MHPTNRWSLVRLGLTTFVSAFLLFLVQPLIARAILPWFGGSPAVWTNCMLFFQGLLLGGYALSALAEQLRPRARLLLLLILGGALCTLPLHPATQHQGPPTEQPAYHLLRLLLLSVGLPYLILATTGPLTQAWFRRAAPERSPYRLYALSNTGSLLALLLYPVAIEPWLPLRWQMRLWSGAFLLFAVLYAASLLEDLRRARPLPSAATPAALEEAPAPGVRDRALWLLLPALGSLALLAFTSHVCQNVAVIPFLWVIPLALYLLTFILAFEREGAYRRGPVAAATLVLLVLTTLYSDPNSDRADLAFWKALALYMLALFALCLLCHGELVRRKPHPRHLTTFYLCLSAGGVLAGLFAGLLAPRLFTYYFEWRIALVAGFALAVVVLFQATRPLWHDRFWLFMPAVAIALCGLFWVGLHTRPDKKPVLIALRNFYGVLRVAERAADDPAEHDRVLYHGSINHGVQFQHGERRREAVSYYSVETGVGRLLSALADTPGLRVGVIGLGTGTLATYARPGQVYRFYEIDPDVVHLSRSYFSYLRDSRGQIEVALGDARLTLDREREPPLHALAVDAFSGDAIPTHLLTREAMDIYLRRLRPDGALAVHISNRHLDLAPVVRALAAYAGWQAVHISNRRREGEHYAADWIIVTRNPVVLAALREHATPPKGRDLLWTDESNDLFRILY